MHIPPGFTTLFPYVFADDALAYLDFLKAALGGEVTEVEETGGRLRNAHIRFGDTTMMVSEASEGFPASQASFYLYVADADAAMARALAAGGEAVMAVADMPYGDRQGGVRDPRGNIWWLSQRLAAGAY